MKANGKKKRLDQLDQIKPEDLPVEELVDLFRGMPCEFTWDDFAEEVKACEQEQAQRPNPSDGRREASDQKSLPSGRCSTWRKRRWPESQRFQGS